MTNILLSILLGLAPLHEAGFQGQDKTIAVIDGGFYHYDDTLSMPSQQVIGIYDLIEDSIQQTDILESVEERHGTMCLSTMLYQDSSFCGTAPRAQYILIRTEDSHAEYIGEVDRLLRGMQLADSLGADILTISLGYYEFDNPEDNFHYSDMDGRHTVSQYATELMRKGRLVCVAAGNMGNQPWHYIDLPADADSILTVGACDNDGWIAPFSSVGPTFDGRIKPDVMAPGRITTVYDPHSHQLVSNNGTSFACPEIAGMAASLWSAMPELTAMQLRELIIQSADRYTQPDNEYGYGQPNAWEAYTHYLYTALSNPSSTTPVYKVLKEGRIIIHGSSGQYNILGEKIE